MPAAEMVVARYPQHSTRIPTISAALTTAGITHDCRPYIVDQPRSRAHGAPYIMIVVPGGPGSRAMEAFDVARRA